MQSVKGSSVKQIGVGKRNYVGTDNKAIDLKDVDLRKITNQYILASIHL